jgi:predicted membrane protein
MTSSILLTILFFVLASAVAIIFGLIAIYCAISYIDRSMKDIDLGDYEEEV